VQGLCARLWSSSVRGNRASCDAGALWVERYASAMIPHSSDTRPLTDELRPRKTAAAGAGGRLFIGRAPCPLRAHKSKLLVYARLAERSRKG
jgi:hypothetical protein